MKLRSHILQHIHLDVTHSLLTVRSVNIVLYWFEMLDIHNKQGLNDIQFCQFLGTVTDLNKTKIYKVFDMLDVDASGEIEFDEFYLLVCILISIKDDEEKQFIYRHCRTVFDLLDEDGSKTVSAEEFENFGFLFNFQRDTVRRIFNEFDVTGDHELDYKEFRMFAMACIDKQKELRELDKKRNQERKNSFLGRVRARVVNLFHTNDVTQTVTFYKEGEQPEAPVITTKDARKKTNLDKTASVHMT